MLVGVAGLALAPQVAAHTSRTVVQVLHAWLCTSLVAGAFVVVRLSDDSEGATESR
jgi:hypothetical protein